MSAEFHYDVFLSHSTKDKAVVRPLAERLRKDGLKVWYDEWEIKPGDSIPSKIEEGLERSRLLVLCMSANAFGSDWAKLENQTFRFSDPLNKERRFIPLRLDDSPIKGSLVQFRYINWLPDKRKQAYPKLLEACHQPDKWPQPSPDSPRTGVSLKRFDHLREDGLDREEVLAAIQKFHRAIWDYKDSLEWVQRLNRPAKTGEGSEARATRDETRDFCSNRNDLAWQQAAATLPIILRAGEHIGIATANVKETIAYSPHSPEWLQGVQDLVKAIEARLEDTTSVETAAKVPASSSIKAKKPKASPQASATTPKLCLEFDIDASPVVPDSLIEQMSDDLTYEAKKGVVPPATIEVRGLTEFRKRLSNLERKRTLLPAEKKERLRLFDTIKDLATNKKQIENALGILFNEEALRWIEGLCVNDGIAACLKGYVSLLSVEPVIRELTKFDVWRADFPKLNVAIWVDKAEVTELMSKFQYSDMKAFTLGGHYASDFSHSTIVGKVYPRIIFELTRKSEHYTGAQVRELFNVMNWQMGLG